MDPLSKTEAQRRVDDLAAFQRELDQLEKEEVLRLSEEQKQTVRAHHQTLGQHYARAFDIDPDRKSHQLSLGMRIASFLGALALCTSIFFLFFRFWGFFSPVQQMLLLSTGSVLTLLLTFLVDSRDRSGYFTQLAALAAFACFYLNLSMPVQIFNMAPSDMGFLVAAAFACLLAYSFRLRLLLAFGILLAAAYISCRAGVWGGLYWLYFGQRPENLLPAALVLFVLPSVISHSRYPGFAPLYRIFALLLAFLPILLLSYWGEISYLLWDPDVIEGFYQFVGFGGLVLFIGLGIRKGWAEVVRTATVLFILFFYTKLFDWWWEWMPKYIFFLIIALTAVLFILVLGRLRKRNIHREGVPA